MYNTVFATFFLGHMHKYTVTFMMLAGVSPQMLIPTMNDKLQTGGTAPGSEAAHPGPHCCHGQSN